MLSSSTLAPGCASATACLTASRTRLSVLWFAPAASTGSNGVNQRQAQNNGQSHRRYCWPSISFPIVESSYRVSVMPSASWSPLSWRGRYGSRALAPDRPVFSLPRKIREKRGDFERHLFVFRHRAHWLGPDHLQLITPGIEFDPPAER